MMELKFPAVIQPVSELEKNTKLIGQFKAKAPLNKLVFGTKLNTTFKDSLTGRQYAKASVTCESTAVDNVDLRNPTGSATPGNGLVLSTGVVRPRPVVKMGEDEFDENAWVKYLCNGWKNENTISYNDVYTSLMELKVLIEKRCFHEIHDKDITVHYKVMGPVMKNASSQTEDSVLAGNSFSADCITVECELLSPGGESGSDAPRVENSGTSNGNSTIDQPNGLDKADETLTRSVGQGFLNLNGQPNLAQDSAPKNPETRDRSTIVKEERPSPGADVGNIPPATSEATSAEQNLPRELTSLPSQSGQSSEQPKANADVSGVNLPSQSTQASTSQNAATIVLTTTTLKREPTENPASNPFFLRSVIDDSEFPNRTTASTPGTSSKGLLTFSVSNPERASAQQKPPVVGLAVGNQGSSSCSVRNSTLTDDASETSSLVDSVGSSTNGPESTSTGLTSQSNLTSSLVSVTSDNYTENTSYIRAAPRKTIKTKPKLVRARNDVRSADSPEPSTACSASSDASPQTPTNAGIQNESLSIKVTEVSSVARLRSDVAALAGTVENASGNLQTSSRSEEQQRREKSPSPKLQQIPLKRSPVSPSGKQGRTTPTTTSATEPTGSTKSLSNTRCDSSKIPSTSQSSPCGSASNAQVSKRKSKTSESNTVSQSKNGMLQLRQVNADERSSIQVFEVLNLEQIRSSMESVIQPTRYFPCSVCSPLPVRAKGLSSKGTECSVPWNLYPKNPKLYPPINIYQGSELVKYQVEIARYAPQLKKISNLVINGWDDEITCLYLIRVIPECDLEFCVKVNSLSEDVAKFPISDKYSLIVNLNEVKREIDMFPGVVIVKGSSTSQSQNYTTDPCSTFKNRKRPLSSDRSQQSPKPKLNARETLSSKSSKPMPVAIKKSTVSEPTMSESLASNYEGSSPSTTSVQDSGCQDLGRNNEISENASTISGSNDSSTCSSSLASTSASPGKSFARKSLVRNVVPNRDLNHNRSDMQTSNVESATGLECTSTSVSNTVSAKRPKNENATAVSDEELKRANSFALRELNNGSSPESGQATLERHLELGCENCEQKEASGFVHRCRFCTEHFITIKSLRHHLFDYHKRFICVPCGQKFSKEFQLREHVLRCS